MIWFVQFICASNSPFVPPVAMRDTKTALPHVKFKIMNDYFKHLFDLIF